MSSADVVAAAPGGGRRAVGQSLPRWLRRVRRKAHREMRRAALAGWLPRGWGWGGAFWRVAPVRRAFGHMAGKPVDRYYIEAFLERHRGDVQGRVLEVGDDRYTRRYGGARVVASDVLHRLEGVPEVTIVDDLAAPRNLPPGSFDCVICTQTLQYIFDVRAAVRSLHDALRPGGVLLLSVPCISQISRYDSEQWGCFWRFTPQGTERLLQEFFPEEHVQVEPAGNVLAAVAFLHGLVVPELKEEELDQGDGDYVLTVLARAQKPAGPVGA